MKGSAMVRDSGQDGSLSTDSSQPSRDEQRMARPKRREKVTAQEMEQRFEGWAMARREKAAERTPEQSAARLRRNPLAGMLLVIAVLVVFVGIEGNGYQAASAQAQSRLTELEADLAAAQASRDDEARTRELIELSEEVSTKAGEVAEAQQGFAALERKAATSPSPDNGAPSKQMRAVAEHRRTLAPYFDDNSFVVEGEGAYQWSTAVTYEADEVDPRYAWYVRHDDTVPSPPSASTWRVEAAMPVVGQEGRAHVVWVCIDSDTGQVLAYASADYSAKDDTFSSLAVGVTALGHHYDGSEKAYADGDSHD